MRCTSFGGPRLGLNTGAGSLKPVIIIIILAQANINSNYCSGTKVIMLYIISEAHIPEGKGGLIIYAKFTGN